MHFFYFFNCRDILQYLVYDNTHILIPVLLSDKLFNTGFRNINVILIYSCLLKSNK